MKNRYFRKFVSLLVTDLYKSGSYIGWPEDYSFWAGEHSILVLLKPPIIDILLHFMLLFSQIC